MTSIVLRLYTTHKPSPRILFFIFPGWSSSPTSFSRASRRQDHAGHDREVWDHGVALHYLRLLGGGVPHGHPVSGSSSPRRSQPHVAAEPRAHVSQRAVFPAWFPTAPHFQSRSTWKVSPSRGSCKKYVWNEYGGSICICAKHVAKVLKKRRNEPHGCKSSNHFPPWKLHGRTSWFSGRLKAEFKGSNKSMSHKWMSHLYTRELGPQEGKIYEEIIFFKVPFWE